MENRWHKPKEQMPPSGEDVLMIVTGRPEHNVTILHGVETGCFIRKEGWVVNDNPFWEDPVVEYWMPLPALPDDIEEDIETIMIGAADSQKIFDKIMEREDMENG